jgi:hypothetical protein
MKEVYESEKFLKLQVSLSEFHFSFTLHSVSLDIVTADHHVALSACASTL